MLKPPEGQITFLFTDIEGSTKLSQQFPDKLPAALEKHHAILIESIESNKGFVFQNVGDAFCCAFASPEDAVKAAIAVQISLANEKWDEAVINVRIGIHSGYAEWNGKNYMGYITLARTARVMSAAYGGQILVSNDAYNFCKDNCEKVKEDDVSFRDLGERRLKDVIEPIRLYQVLSKGLREEFPPLMTLDARPNNLPIQLTSFIGREREMKDVKNRLRQNRLLTLTATGGAGKSRLSLQAGADMIDDFANGVWFVELAAVSDPDFLTAAIINALGIKEEPKKTPEESLVDYLRDKEILIILDNCEHLINACADLTERLLSSCPKLKIIATSREALNCSGEQIFRIPALTHPEPNSKDTPEQLTQYESVRLFIERALSVNPKFRVNNENAPALSEVCSRLDGIPLAIELAAARIKVLSIEKIYERLDDRFNLLTGGKRTALPRQQTLRALIDWSYDLLTEKERMLWSRLSVFSGGWTLEAAEEICSDESINKYGIIDHLSELAEKSIIIFNESKERYNILETIKQYGREKLENENQIFLKHLDYFLDLAKKAEPELSRSDAKLWLDKLEADHSNFLSAIEWSVENGETEKGAGAASALAGFWNIRGYYSTGIELLYIILNKKFELSKSAEAKVLNGIGSFNRQQGNFEKAKKFCEESLDIFRETGDKREIASSLNNLGSVLFVQGNYEPAKKYYEESLTIYEEIGNKVGIAVSLQNLGNVAGIQGDYEQAKKYFKEGLDIRIKIGDNSGIAKCLYSLGNEAHNQGDYEQAKKYYEESLTIYEEIGNKQGIANTLNNLGIVADYQGNYEQAKEYYEESLDIRKEIGDKMGIAVSLQNLGDIVMEMGDLEKAKICLEESLDIREEIGDKRGVAYSIASLGHLALYVGDYKQAMKFYEESLDIRKELGNKNEIAISINSFGNLAIVQGDFEQAKKYLEESLVIRKEIGGKRGIAESMSGLGSVFANKGDFELAVKLLSASEKIMESIGGSFFKIGQKIRDETTAKLQEQQSEEEFNEYREEGQKLTLEEAVELALKKDDNA